MPVPICLFQAHFDRPAGKTTSKSLFFSNLETKKAFSLEKYDITTSDIVFRWKLVSERELLITYIYPHESE